MSSFMMFYDILTYHWQYLYQFKFILDVYTFYIWEMIEADAEGGRKGKKSVI